jgi:acyl-CoA synthetase (NDP forming)
MASGFLTSLIEQKYHERSPLYIINPKADEISGIKCYPNLQSIPGPVDHVISLVPEKIVPALVQQAIEKKVKSVHFYTAGFSETGDPERAALETKIVGELTEAGIRVIGPNCMGLYVPSEGLAFMNGFPETPGNVAVISQSGANAGDMIHGMSRRGVRFSKGVSFGNGADLKAHHFFAYLAEDPETEVITAYLEGVQEGRNFFKAVKRLAETKPVILLKGGLTAAGARAAHSHTGSLAGEIKIFDAMCRQTGASRAITMEDLHDFTVGATTSMKNIKGTGVALVSGGGGFAVLSADAIAMAGLDVPSTPEATKLKLREFVPIAGTSINNPIDTNTGGDIQIWERTIRTVAGADNIDLVLGTLPWSSSAADQDELTKEQLEEEIDTYIKMIVSIQNDTGTPVAMLLRQRGDDRAAAHLFELAAYKNQIPCFATVPRAARTAAEMLAWANRRAGLPQLF